MKREMLPLFAVSLFHGSKLDGSRLKIASFAEWRCAAERRGGSMAPDCADTAAKRAVALANGVTVSSGVAHTRLPNGQQCRQSVSIKWRSKVG